MTITPNLALPYIMAAQAQKHVTHNEAVRALDALVQLSALNRTLAAAPASPLDGVRYIVAANPTGVWSGHANDIAAFQDGAWAFYHPATGWQCWIADEKVVLAWNGAAWVAAAGVASVNPTPLVGVNATADTTNRLAVKSQASLFDNSGNGHQLKINKATPADTASTLYQTAYSGRAEMGLAGDDNFHVKVSPDGATWKESILVNRTTGSVSFPNTSLPGSVTITQSAAPYTFNLPLLDATATEGGAGELFGFCGNAAQWNNAGGTGLNPYYDHTAFLGFNLKDGGVQKNTALPAFGLGFESKFTQSGGTAFGHEFYIRCLRTDGSEFRPFGFWIDYTGGNNGDNGNGGVGTIGGFNTSQFYLNSPASGTSTGTQQLQCVWKTNTIYLYNSNKLRFQNAGVPVAQQSNGNSTAWLNLPYIAQGDRLVLEQGVLHTPPVTTDGATPIHAVSVQGTPTTNQIGYQVSFAAAVNKVITGFQVLGTTNWNVTNQIFNYGTGTAQLDIGSSSTSPAYIHFIRLGGQEWVCGKNYGDNFEIGTGSLPSQAPALIIDKTTRQTAFNAPPKLPSYPVASLPAAATAGAGAMAYVSNASGGSTLACSDGTNWRVVAALGAVVA